MIAYIPARLGSSRFPRKILAQINGKPLIRIMAENAAKCDYIDKVHVLTDHQDIADVIRKIDDIKITCDAHTHGSCGTDRAFNVHGYYGNTTPFVVIQADCPDLTNLDLNFFLANIISDPLPSVHTIVCPMSQSEALKHQNVKVVFTSENMAVYFSRSMIPFDSSQYFKHVGVYAFTTPTINNYRNILQAGHGHMASSEDLEQLQWMMNGVPIKITRIDHYFRSLDTPEDYLQFSSAGG